jgi:hypothetical protein
VVGAALVDPNAIERDLIISSGIAPAEPRAEPKAL